MSVVLDYQHSNIRSVILVTTYDYFVLQCMVVLVFTSNISISCSLSFTNRLPFHQKIHYVFITRYVSTVIIAVTD